MQIIYANSFRKRLCGFCFQKKINNVLVLPNCNSIHTFFMRSNIDVYMTDKNKKVQYVFKNLPPFKIILPKKDVFYVYETPVNHYNFKINDVITF